MNDYMIETRNLTKKYGSQVSVSNLNIHVRKGRIMATATCGLLYGAKAVISLWSRKRSAILCAL